MAGGRQWASLTSRLRKRLRELSSRNLRISSNSSNSRGTIMTTKMTEVKAAEEEATMTVTAETVVVAEMTETIETTVNKSTSRSRTPMSPLRAIIRETEAREMAATVMTRIGSRRTISRNKECVHHQPFSRKRPSSSRSGTSSNHTTRDRLRKKNQRSQKTERKSPRKQRSPRKVRKLISRR